MGPVPTRLPRVNSIADTSRRVWRCSQDRAEASTPTRSQSDMKLTDRQARATGAAPGRGGAARLMRRRLGCAALDRERLGYAPSALAVGAEIEWDNHDPDDPLEPLVAVFERASGLDRVRRDTFLGV